ncbi:MAG: hypothetical protein KJO42_13510 [Silicimonas sp.]|nr:hypothetical protein [Silicimonas sp.]NND17368.1 hypothetical protein [Silicimonas sp.]NND21207.1 hypothetical protein [Silicimonas sp.]NND42095.1 hypothetical protein [Silicimonas sp.]NNL72695.1 hypothetical protein [Silicimonas sp.]
MRKLLTLVPVALGAFAGYAIAFRAIPPGSLAATADEISSLLGPGLAGALIFSTGVLLSWAISRTGRRSG